MAVNVLIVKTTDAMFEVIDAIDLTMRNGRYYFAVPKPPLYFPRTITINGSSRREDSSSSLEQWEIASFFFSRDNVRKRRRDTRDGLASSVT